MADCAYCKAETQLFDSGVPICLRCVEKREGKAKSSQGQQEVYGTLVAGVSDATARASAANEAFKAVINSVPSGIPHPDGSQRINNVSRELAAARQELTDAHKRLSDFVDRGIVPDELKRNTAKPGE